MAVPASCKALECEDAGCRLSMEGVSEPWFMANLDCDALGLQSVTHADFMLATWDGILACIELKGGRSISGAVRQLQESSSLAEDVLNLSEHVTTFRPVLGHHTGLRTGQRKHLQRERIQFQSGSHSIRLVKCGGRLADAFRGPA